MRRLTLMLAATVLAVMTGLGSAAAQDKPRSGGELIFVVPPSPRPTMATRR